MTTAEGLLHFRIAALAALDWDESVPPRTPAAEVAVRPLWFTPKAVEEVDPAGYWHLSADARDELLAAKDEFLRLARAGGEANVGPARAALRTLFRIAGPHLFDDETRRTAVLLQRILRQPKYGGWFVGFDCVLRDDWSGDPSLTVWLHIAPGTYEHPEFQKGWASFGHIFAIKDDLKAAGMTERLVYLNLHWTDQLADVLEHGDGE